MPKIKSNITIKLFVMLSASFVVFAMVLVLIQFFIVGRMYYTTRYTTERLLSLSSAIGEIEYSYEMSDPKAVDEIIESTLQDYSKKYNCYFFTFDDKGKLKYSTTDIKKNLGDYYIDRAIGQIRTDNSESNFLGIRITGFLGLPSKYVAVYQKSQESNTSSSSGKNNNADGLQKDNPSIYIVAVTAEAYTSKNVDIFKSYVTYVLVLVLIISILIAALFSLIITRRVVKIKNIAAKMAQLNFTEKCLVKSNDEIGVLAQTLNFLSERLDNTLDELSHANKRLKSDLELQRDIDKMRKDFIAAVSHEFKTPLTLIRGYTEGIQSHFINEKDYEDAQNIVMDEVDKMDTLVGELLELSTLDSPCYGLCKSSFLVDDLLHIIENKYSIIAKKRGVKFDLKSLCNHIEIHADGLRIEQVISNFLNNALDNTATGSSIILKSEIENNFVRISVFNEGHNISEKDIDRIWDYFYRSDVSRSKKTGGTGLGLAICKVILEKHGAQYGVINKENGVEFYFVI